MPSASAHCLPFSKCTLCILSSTNSFYVGLPAVHVDSTPAFAYLATIQFSSRRYVSWVTELALVAPCPSNPFFFKFPCHIVVCPSTYNTCFVLITQFSVTFPQCNVCFSRRMIFLFILLKFENLCSQHPQQMVLHPPVERCQGWGKSVDIIPTNFLLRIHSINLLSIYYTLDTDLGTGDTEI